jgi:nitroreductase
MSEKSMKLKNESVKRRSYRSFLPEKIDKETIEDWLMTASSAPSGANKQPWFFCVVTDEVIKSKVREEAEKIEKEFYEKKISEKWREDLKSLKTDYQKNFLTEASCLIVIFKEVYRINELNIKETNYYPTECVGLATGLLINAIRDSGYSSLTYTPAPSIFLKKLFNRPIGEMAVMILAVGKANSDYQLPELRKKTINEIAKFY